MSEVIEEDKTSEKIKNKFIHSVKNFKLQLQEKITSTFPSWNDVKRSNNNKIVKSSYFWAIFTPIFAKNISGIEAIASKFANKPIELSLPFTWQLFYFGAIAFAISGVIFASRCPYLIKNYESPYEYREKGRCQFELDQYADETFRDFKNKNELISEYFGIINDVHEERFNTQFFFLKRKTKHKRLIDLIICRISQVFGYVCFIAVAIENFAYVCKNTDINQIFIYLSIFKG